MNIQDDKGVSTLSVQYKHLLRSACVLRILFCFSLSCLSVFLFAPLLDRCLLADSTANHHSDVMMFCQSADVPAVFEDSS